MIHKNLYIIDMMHLAHRCYHVHKDLFTDDGKPTGMIYGAKNFLEGFIDQFNPDYLVAARECEGPSIRHKLYPEYKANRSEKDEQFLEQLPDFFRLFEEIGIPIIQKDEYEADDVIGSLVTKFASSQIHCFIVSADKDFMQLVNEFVTIVKPTKNRTYELINPNVVISKTGLRPDQIIDYLGLIGDAADNIPGVRGIGPKNAEKLLKSYQTIEGIYANLYRVDKSNAQKLNGNPKGFFSKELVKIYTNLEIDCDIHDMVIFKDDLSKPNVIAFYKSLEFQV